MIRLNTLYTAIHTFGTASSHLDRYDGVILEQMRHVGRQHGVDRWKRAPGGTGSNANYVELSLRANGLQLYSRLANLIVGKDGTVMAAEVLRNISFADFVIILDVRYETAQHLASGTFEFSTPADPDAIGHYRNDAIRAAAYNDALRVSCDIVLPALLGGKKAA
jgi:hypothetical protein